MRFDAPWFLLLLLAVPLVLWMHRRHGAPPALVFSSTASLAALPRSRRQAFEPAPFWMRLAALVLLVLALARPQIGAQRVRQMGKGIALEVVIDRSSSMSAAIEFEHEQLSRIDLAKRVFRNFVAGGAGLRGRGSDLIGVVAFSGTPETVCPLTYAHENVLRALAPVRLAVQGEDGTAIGDALALAAARLKMLDREPGAPRSKVVVLITDGENNRGEMPVFEAAKLAAEWGIRVYTIGIFDVQRTFKYEYEFELFAAFRRGIDTTLGRLADMTGGLYRSVQSGGALESIYREIDRLEKSDVPVMRHVKARELYPPLASVALALLALQAVLSATWLRRIP